MSVADKVKLFAKVFRGRPDVHARRREGVGYASVPGPIDANSVELHLSGQEVLGVYPLLADNTTWFLAIDFEGRSAPREGQRAWRALEAAGVPAYLERSSSGQGARVWVFFDRPTQARRARKLSRLCAVTRSRIFPLPPSAPLFDAKPDTEEPGGCVPLPLEGRAAALGNSIFLDPRTMLPLPDQWALLRGVARLSRGELARAVPEPPTVPKERGRREPAGQLDLFG